MTTYTMTDAARQTGLTYWQIYRSIEHGVIAPQRFGRAYALSASDLDRLREHHNCVRRRTSG
jgi:excisionase family DNA binding protein